MWFGTTPPPQSTRYTPTLTSIQEYGADNSTLPATTFTYSDAMHLTRADNGYKGRVEFVYSGWRARLRPGGRRRPGQRRLCQLELGHEGIYTCPGGSCGYGDANVQGVQWYVYDSNNWYNLLPSQGKLTKQRTLVCHATGSNVCVGPRGRGRASSSATCS